MENKQINEQNKTRYAIVCEKFSIPQSYFDDYETAMRFAKLNPQKDKPYYIVKCVETYEIIDSVE